LLLGQSARRVRLLSAVVRKASKLRGDNAKIVVAGWKKGFLKFRWMMSFTVDEDGGR